VDTHGLQVTVVAPGEAAWPDLVALFGDYRAHYGRDRDPQRCERWLREHVDAGRLRCYLARSPGDDEPVAMAVVAPSAPASLSLGAFWSLRDLYVAPGHRRQGAARTVVERVVTDAQAAGAVRVGLQTEPGNEAALALYRSVGFEDVTGVTQLMLEL
jgi:ribosomal protein S18 acetylase RimI-like enzyme